MGAGHLLVGQSPVCLIDEPEMCLHPPQAYALGRFIGKYGTRNEQSIFVATHSSHILRGIIDQTAKLEIIRLSRASTRFVGQKISNDVIQACIEKPSTKIETILDGLFAEAVTIVESEGDRLVYSTTWEQLSGEFKHDVHFVSVGGLGGIADTCQLYRKLRIPVCVIADLDLLRELDTFTRIVQSLASADISTEVIASCRSLFERVKSLGPLYTEMQTKEKLTEMLNAGLNWSNEEQLAGTRRLLSDISEGLSPTARLKGGLAALQSQDLRHDLEAFITRCRCFGLFLVPFGELEDWLSTHMTSSPSRKKKAEWANAAANKLRDIQVQNDDIWEFIRGMARFQQHEAARLSGFVA